MQKAETQIETKTQVKPKLDLTAKQLEEKLVAAGATVAHPVKHDPAVFKDGKCIGFFTE